MYQRVMGTVKNNKKWNFDIPSITSTFNCRVGLALVTAGSPIGLKIGWSGFERSLGHCVVFLWKTPDSHSSSSQWRMHSNAFALRRANARNSIRGPVYVINSVDKTKLPCYTLSPTQHHSFFRNLSPIQGEFDIKKTSPEGAQSPNQRKVE